MRIGDRQIGQGHPPYIVAEMSGEHRRDIVRAYALIDAAKDAGCDAIKCQHFDPLKLAEARGGKDKILTEGLWKGRTLYSLYLETWTEPRWFPLLFDYAKQRGITLFSSVFDEEGVDYLESLGFLCCPAYKIASFEINNLALIRKAAATGKPLIISTGMATLGEIRAAVTAGLQGSQNQTRTFSRGFYRALLHCVSAYPCTIADANLGRLKEAATDWPARVFGLSDHTIGNTAAIVATALGASIIEKHITLSREGENAGPDAPYSLEPNELKRFVQDVRDAWASLGTGERPASEEMYRSLRSRSA